MTAMCAVDAERVHDDVAFFASDACRGRIPGDEGNDVALEFAEAEFALAGGDDAPNRWLTDLMVNAAEEAGIEHVIELVPQKLASDHAPFVQRGIPVCWGFARPDPHPGYIPQDDMSRVKLQSLRAVSELFWAALKPLALGSEERFLSPPASEHFIEQASAATRQALEHTHRGG